MPYLESNEPFNPLPGIMGGAAIGGLGGAASGWLGTTAVNANRQDRFDRRDKNTTKLQNEIKALDGQIDNANSKTFVQNADGSPITSMRKEGQGASQSYMDNLSEMKKKTQDKHEKLASKQLRGKIGKGKAGLFIGGTTLAGGLIGGSAMMVGNSN